MRVVEVSEETFDSEYQASTDAIRDFLYMYFEIAGDCLPVGDFDRAAVGAVDPFRYLDVTFESTYQLRSRGELAFLHHGAAVKLLCCLAQAVDDDESSGSKLVPAFRDALARGEEDGALRALAPDLHAIFEAYRDGRIVQTPAIQQAFRAAFFDTEKQFFSSLAGVLSEVILPAFDTLAEP